MKQTLLELTQAVLRSVIGDEITSITDTEESDIISYLIQEVYLEMIDGRDWEHLLKPSEPAASAGASTPTHIQMSDGLVKIKFIRYDVQTTDDGGRKIYREIPYLFPDEFFARIEGRDNTDSTVDVITDPNGIDILIKNDQAPQYWTSLDEEYIIFDSYDNTIETVGIDKDKLVIYGYVEPTWTHSDSFTPDLPSDAFSLLREEAKSRAAVELKGVANEKAEQASQRERRRVARSAWRTNQGLRYKNYGRRGVK